MIRQGSLDKRHQGLQEAAMQEAATCDTRHQGLGRVLLNLKESVSTSTNQRVIGLRYQVVLVHPNTLSCTFCF